MWEFRQATGELIHDSEQIAYGYSGNGIGKNNPAVQSVHDVGPIPCGLYQITSPQDTKEHGPYVLALLPDPRNEMFGRSAFLIHGDSIHDPGMASKGCIIASRITRTKIWESGDRMLKVTSGLRNA